MSTRNSDRDKVDLIVTGGGTGGHVFPALEIADAARSAGCRVRYFGSLRGQERDAAAALGFEFLGFPSEPLYGFRTLRGWRAALSFLRARSSAKLALKAQRPTIVFSTGGYASAPIVSASRSLGIPYVIHEQNSVPGRTNKILSRGARAVATVFHASAQHFPDGKVVRTGMPVRRVLRDAAKDVNDSGLHILVMGGSQGATALNDVALSTAVRMGAGVNWLHLCGASHLDVALKTKAQLGLGDHYNIRGFLQGSDMASALAQALLVVCRSGAGTLAELATFRKPSVLVPYPLAFGDHQRFNALEFVDMGAATILEQSNLQPSSLESEISSWLDSANRQGTVSQALAAWDIPDATTRVLDLLLEH